MTSRERFRAALNHQEGDRIPIDVGQDFHNGIHEVAYRNLLAHLGKSDEIRIYDQMQHLAVVKEDILNRLHADTRYVFAGAADGFELKIEDDTSWLDEWGVKRKTCGYYDENVDPPLKEFTAEKLKRYKMPDPREPARFKGLRTKAKVLTRDTEYALVCGNACSLFFLSSELTGFQEYMEKDLGYTLIPVSRKDQNLYGINFLTIRPDRIMAIDGVSDKYKKLLKKHGVDATWMDFSALTSGYGAAHCTTQVLLREAP